MESAASGALAEKLMQFGLTRQEAVIYLCLMRNKELSGYEVSKLTGISRSNVYSALAGLVEEGAAYLLEGSTNKYIAVEVGDFCQNRIRRLEQLSHVLISEIPRADAECDGYITISGHRHIMDKIYTMLEHVAYRAYIAMETKYLEPLREPLTRLTASGKKLVLLVDEPFEEEIAGSIVYITGNRDGQIRLIVDSTHVLTGDMTGADTDSCLYCGQKNFVRVFKDSLKNEIRLIELTGGRKQL
ncbi:MAG: TrmB family transcriptional regulator [Roseburia sp.]|nr:TrmB family transcriptional regulator [Roseburia sp.]